MLDYSYLNPESFHSVSGFYLCGMEPGDEAIVHAVHFTVLTNMRTPYSHPIQECVNNGFQDEALSYLWLLLKAQVWNLGMAVHTQCGTLSSYVPIMQS